MINKNVKSFNLISLNCQGLRDKHKRLRLIQWLKNQQTNIALLQETHFSDEIITSVDHDFNDWKCIHAFGERNSRGCSILLHKNITYEILNQSTDINGRYILLNIQIYEIVYTIITVYAPNDKKSRNIFYNNIRTVILNNSQGNYIIGGDHNDILNDNDRISSSKNTSRHATVKSLHELIKIYKLIDIWRKIHSNKQQFTWRRKNGNDKSRIDFWLIDRNLVQQISSTDIRPAIINNTDHMAISLKINTPSDRGPGYWKFNNALLKDNEYVQEIETLVESFKSLHVNHQTKWELCKLEIKSFSIYYSKKKSKHRYNEIQQLEKQLKQLYELQEKKDNDYSNNMISEIELKIHTLYEVKTEGAKIRSRLKLLEDNEKSSKYFLNLEKSRQNSKVIHELKVNDKIVTSNIDILNAQCKFYETLYTSDNINNKDYSSSYLNNTTFDKILTDDMSNQCEGIFTYEEASEALKNMKQNKSPGLDGLTVEFYEQFWNILGILVLNSLNKGYITGELSHTQKQSVFSLILKKATLNVLKTGDPYHF